MSMFLKPAEVEELTRRERAAAQRRVLRAMGIAFVQDNEGRPVVLRALVESMMGAPVAQKREPELRL